MNVANQTLEQLTKSWGDFSQVMAMGNASSSSDASQFKTALRDAAQQARDSQPDQAASTSRKPQKEQTEGGQKTEDTGKAEPEAVQTKGNSVQKAEPKEEMSTLDRMTLAAALMMPGQPQVVMAADVPKEEFLPEQVTEIQPEQAEVLPEEILPQLTQEGEPAAVEAVAAETAAVEHPVTQASMQTEAKEDQPTQEIRREESPVDVERRPVTRESRTQERQDVQTRSDETAVEVKTAPGVKAPVAGAERPNTTLHGVHLTRVEEENTLTVEEPSTENGQVLQELTGDETGEVQHAAHAVETPVVATEEETVEEETAVTDSSQPLFDENLEAVPVRVATTPKEDFAPVELSATDAPEQLAAQLDQAIDSGESHIELSLTPESLGKVTVELTRMEDGTLNVILSATTSKATALLEQHSDGLHQLLAARNPGEVQVEVRSNQESQPQFLNPNGDNENAREQQRQEQERRQQEQENQQAHDTDFMQRLRLGLSAI